MHRSAHRLTRILAASAAVPAILLATGCSMLSGGDDGGGSESTPSQKPEATPTVKAAKFSKLPDACSSIPEKTVKKLVPKVKSPSGTAVKSSDAAARGGCTWSGLDDNGLKGSDFRWLDVSFQRYESDLSLGTGEKRAEAYFKKQSLLLAKPEGGKEVSTGRAEGVGDEAATVSYETTKDKEQYVNQTVIARTANVVVTVNYNGSGLQGAKDPKSADMLKDAQQALAAAVSAVK